jgi:hypothetical protein
MVSVKIALPNGGKNSSAFKDALKVSIAASAYNSTVQWEKGSHTQESDGSDPSCGWKSHFREQEGETRIDRRKCYRSVRTIFKVFLFRYLHETATKHIATWTDLSLIEWESSKFSSLKEPAAALKEVESKLSHKELTDFTSPASIVIFSSLYSIMSFAKLLHYPATEKFFIGFIETETAKKGIELATAHTAERKVDGSPLAGASNSVAKSTTPGAQHLRPGIFTNKLDGKKMYSPCQHH